MLSLPPADLHVRRLARLGRPHVTLPGHPALVFKLPHRQVTPLPTVALTLLSSWQFYPRD